MNDVNTVMRNSGVAIMGSSAAEGEDRAMIAVQAALESPLLNDNDIQGARYVLLNITYGNREVLMDEITEITDYIQEAAGSTADVIWGHAMDESLEDKLCVTIIATGFNQKIGVDLETRAPEKKYHKLTDLETDSSHRAITNPVNSPTEQFAPVNQNPPAEPENEPNEPFIKNVQASEKQGSLLFGKEEQAEPYMKKPEASPQPAEQSSAASTDSEPAEQPKPERKVYTLDDELPAEEDQPPVQYGKRSADVEEEKLYTPSQSLTKEEIQRMTNQRMHRIKELTVRLKTPSGLTDLEDEPAYKRRNIRLDEPPHSSDSQASRYTLSEDGDI